MNWFLLLSLFVIGAYGVTKNEEYDYIVVGGGSSGATLVGRLTEEEQLSVVLLEAGGYPSAFSDIPLLGSKLIGSEIDWKYTTVPQKNCFLGVLDQKARWPRGKVLGGTSIINAMNYVRGNRRDYDHWKSMGNEGWGYDDLLPYFKKSEGFRVPNAPLIKPSEREEYHNEDGPLTVSWPEYSTRLQDVFIEAGYSFGYTFLDYNGRSQSGFSPNQATIRDGSRCSTEKAFLRPAYGRPNLEVVTYAHVTKILFDDNKRAIGVEYEIDRKPYKVFAKREVILSAGTIASPQLLMLSGVGPKDHLESLGIPVVADLPAVGQNLQEHVAAGGATFQANVSEAINHLWYSMDYYMEQYRLGKGPLTVPYGLQGLAFVKTKYANLTDDYPDIQFTYVTSMGGGLFVDRLFGRQPVPGIDMYSLGPILLRPKSVGYIELNTTDPYDQPIIDPNTFGNEQDFLTLKEGFRLALAIGLAPPFQRYDAKPILNVCNIKFEFGSEEYLDCCVRTFTAPLYHPIGTCRMGPDGDSNSVVDPQLRVKKVTGLRVVDSSVIPGFVSGNTNAAAIMIGEKAADMIKESFYQFVKDDKINTVPAGRSYRVSSAGSVTV